MYISLRCLSWFTEIHVKLISEKVVQVLHMNQNLVSFLCSSFESPKIHRPYSDGVWKDDGARDANNPQAISRLSVSSLPGGTSGQ